MPNHLCHSGFPVRVFVQIIKWTRHPSIAGVWHVSTDCPHIPYRRNISSQHMKQTQNLSHLLYIIYNGTYHGRIYAGVATVSFLTITACQGIHLVLFNFTLIPTTPNASFCMMYLLSLLPSQWRLVWRSLSKSWNRIQSSTREHLCPSKTSRTCWSFACVRPFSCSKTNIMSKTRGSYGVASEPCSGQYVYGVLWRQSTNNSSEPSQMVEKICGWHICHIAKKQERWVPAAHKLCGPSNPVYHRRTKTGWFHAFPGHFSHPSRRWNLDNKSLQKAHSHWSISTVG